MRYLILACLAMFCGERCWLIARHQCRNVLEGLGLLLMGALSVLALAGHLVLAWGS
jgi:hypothetical protein